MSNFHKELMIEIVTKWNDEQLNGYIYSQEERLESIRALVKDLKEIKRRRKKRNPVETGVRGGV